MNLLLDPDPSYFSHGSLCRFEDASFNLRLPHLYTKLCTNDASTSLFKSAPKPVLKQEQKMCLCKSKARRGGV